MGSMEERSGLHATAGTRGLGEDSVTKSPLTKDFHFLRSETTLIPVACSALARIKSQLCTPFREMRSAGLLCAQKIIDINPYTHMTVTRP